MYLLLKKTWTIAQIASPVSPILSVEQLLYAGLTAVTAVIIILWKMILDRMKKTEEDVARRDAMIVEKDKEVDALNAKLQEVSVAAGIAKLCPIDNCPIKSKTK